MTAIEEHRKDTLKAFNNAFGPLNEAEHRAAVGRAYDELVNLFGPRMMYVTPPARAAKALAAGMIASHLKNVTGV